MPLPWRPADARTYTYSTIDFPSATYTHAYGINDRGQIVGGYVDGSGVARRFGRLPGAQQSAVVE